MGTSVLILILYRFKPSTDRFTCWHYGCEKNPILKPGSSTNVRLDLCYWYTLALCGSFGTSSFNECLSSLNTKQWVNRHGGNQADTGKPFLYLWLWCFVWMTRGRWDTFWSTSVHAFSFMQAAGESFHIIWENAVIEENFNYATILFYKRWRTLAVTASLSFLCCEIEI